MKSKGAFGAKHSFVRAMKGRLAADAMCTAIPGEDRMNETPRLAEAAQALREARAARRPIAPISQNHGVANLADAYAIAELNTRSRLEAGHRVVGKKVGLTSRAVQQQLG